VNGLNLLARNRIGEIKARRVPRGDKKREDNSVAARDVEVPKVQGVVFDLSAVGGCEAKASGLEFEHHDHVSGQQHCVNPPRPSGDWVFKQEMPAGGVRKPTDEVACGAPKVLDLLAPGLDRVRQLGGETFASVRRGQSPADRILLGAG
jgi:hypothetical protein